MSEVRKRDKQAQMLANLWATIKKEMDTATSVMLTVWDKQLSEMWQQFKLYHEKVMDRAGDTEVEEQNGFYDQAYSSYYKCSMAIEQKRSIIDDSNAKGKDDANKSALTKINHQYSFAMKRLENMCDRIVDTVGNMKVSELPCERKHIETSYAAIQALGMQRIALGESEQTVFDDEIEADTIFRAALRVVVDAHVDASQIQATDNIGAILDVNALKLPQLQITPFDGQFEKWEAFRESFQHGVHARTNMAGVHKLQCLKSVLRGEPEELIQNFNLTNDNYIAAWKLLTERYNNTFELVSSHIRVLMNLPVCSESSDDLRRISNKTSSSILALQNLKRPVDNWDDWVVYIVSEKLDKESRRMWMQQVATGDDLPTWNQLDRFIQGRVRAIASDGSRSVMPNPRQPSPRSAKMRTNHATAEHEETPHHICAFCNGDHLISYCHSFRNLNLQDRRKTVAEKSLCFVCLGTNHQAISCTSSKTCHYCHRKHSFLLHENNGSGENNHVQVCNAFSSNQIAKQRPAVFLATAVVQVQDNGGDWHQMRALLDQGSDWSLVSERAAITLQLPREKEYLSITGVAGVSAGHCSQSIKMVISDCHGFGEQFELSALILPRLTSHVKPVSLCGDQVWPHLRGLPLADPEFSQRHSFDILIGSEIYGTLLRSGLRQSLGLPTGQNSSLGWLISGAIQENQGIRPSNAQSMSIRHATIDEQLTRFWEIEESTTTTRKLTLEEEKCEAFFEQTVTRDNTGRIHVRLPIKGVDLRFGESQRHAVQRQLQIERRFNTNPEFAVQYRLFINQYLELGHMTEVIGAVVDMTRKREMCAQSGQEYYIPHHAVIKDSSTTTKLRVVFDASRRTTNGVSLNDQLRIGPRLQDNLTAIMMRWRKYRFAMSADIEKMYRQIVIDEPDSDLQRIVWRESSEEKMRVYRLCTVTYGTAAAPYLAVKALQTLAQLESTQYSIGANIIMENCYVDDILSGADTVSECVEAKCQVQGLLTSGGFKLHKWASNCEQVLADIDPAHRECDLPLRFSDDAHVSTLGFFWNPGNDEISVKINIVDEKEIWTKRSFLSAASKMYDPLGWLAPTIIMVKMLFQTLWKHDLDWDDCLPLDLSRQWNHLYFTLQKLRDVRIPRWIGTTTHCEIQIHGFCDASMSAYAAVVFVRVKQNQDLPKVFNICAKTKVAPVKVVSLPRLELCGAALLVKLMDDVVQAMKWADASIYCWTDSTIVLSWLRGHPSRLNIFVANRSAEIQRKIPVEHWRHVSSTDNPADCASRGITPDQLLHHSLWWTGPTWLCEESSNWPKQLIPPETTEEERVHVNVVNISEPWDLSTKYSSWRKLARVTAWCIRFVNNCRMSKEEREGRSIDGLTSSEIMNSREFWVRHYQSNVFIDEFYDLRRNRAIGKNSKLRSLNPFLSADNILRVGGRLINASDLSTAARNPAIIPRQSALSALLIRDAHEQTLHGGPSLMLAFLRRAFWIVDGPNEVRRFVKKCVVCFRYTAKPEHQIMASLPAPRVTPSRPFVHSAMDYTGAIQVRSTRGRGHHATKAYVAVFVCLATKAVHIELVGDLTTSAFIAAYERFTSRRGCCSDLYSDNATNYVGAATVFLRSERHLFNNEVHAALASKGTTWHFAPPLSPHFNGLAEAAIRSVKHHIRRVVGELTLTYEELLTVLTKIEACLNSRPLCPINNNPDSFDALTPGHFLIGEPIQVIPQRDVLDVKTTALTRWQLTHQVVQRFWKRWSSEYLNSLQQRRKWQTATDNIRIGELVLIMEDNIPPAKWILGRIVQIHPGADGNIRVVTLRTKGSTFKRSIVKIARLPIGNTENE